MPRLPTLPLERPMPDADDLEEGVLSDDDSGLSHIKLGTAWLCTTLAGVSLSHTPRCRNFHHLHLLLEGSSWPTQALAGFLEGRTSFNLRTRSIIWAFSGHSLL